MQKKQVKSKTSQQQNRKSDEYSRFEELAKKIITTPKTVVPPKNTKSPEKK
jgi:nitrogenase subunit NifH